MITIKGKSGSERNYHVKETASEFVPEDHMAPVFLRGEAREIGVSKQAEKVRIGGSGKRRVEQVAGDVHHVLLHQVLFRLPCWVEI